MILQSDPAWATARLGHVTASRIADMLAKSRDKKGWGQSRANYAAELIAERLSGTPYEGFKSAEMQRGQEVESEARAAYEFRHDVTTGESAFLKHPHIPFAGASPDGFVDDDGLVEFKCPNTATHIDTLLCQTVPEKYRLQMAWQMTVTARQWCDFVSYDPRLPEEMRLFVQRFERDEAECARLEREVEAFLAEVDDTLKQLRRQYAEAA